MNTFKSHPLILFTNQKKPKPLKTINEMKNKITNESFEILEQSIRKNWLISFIITESIHLLCAIFFESIFYLFGAVIGLIITYHCSYRKKGTALLAWLLLWCPLSFLWTLVHEWNDWGNSEASGFCIASLLFALIYTYYMWNCWQLRKINKQAPHHNPKHLRYIQDINNTSSLDELNEKFAKLIEERPQFEAVLLSEYKLKKSEFLKNQ